MVDFEAPFIEFLRTCEPVDYDHFFWKLSFPFAIMRVSQKTAKILFAYWPNLAVLRLPAWS